MQPLGHAFPVLGRAHVRLNDVLVSLRPSLPGFRRSIIRFPEVLRRWRLQTTIVEFRSSESPNPIYVEILAPPPATGGIASPTGVGATVQAAKTFEEAVSQIRPIASAVFNQLQNLSPDDCSIEFGLKFSAELKMIVASGKGEGNFSVKISWKRKAPENAARTQTESNS